MNLLQANALRNICRSQEDLQNIWNTEARQFQLPNAGKMKLAVVNIAVVEDNGELIWTSAVRILNKKKGKLKRRETWSTIESMSAIMITSHELLGVGDESTGAQFESRHGTHFTKRLTPSEVTLALEPEVLKAIGARAVPVTSIEDARRHLRKLANDLNN